MSPLGRKPLGTPTCLQQVGKRKEPRYQVLNTRYQGSLIDWHLRRCRVAPIRVRGGRDDRHDGGARGIEPAPKKENGRDASENRGTARPGGFTMLSRMDRCERSTRDPTASLSWRGRWWKCRGDSVETRRHSPRILLSPLRAAGAPPPSGHLSWLRPSRRRPGLLPGWRPAFAARW